ncbi:MAG: hypothetical protein CXT73_04030 [Methanobacteriota archaeon]|nr:MAG: hypothetical protein CXT73_04030 [Euryarchaeota archaeon]
MKKKLAVVFDLDKTMGFFTQIAVVMEAIEEVLGRELNKEEFFKFLDIYPHVFRPDMFKIFKYLKKQKRRNKCLKVLIYTNNIGPKSWVMNIRKYIERKLNYRLFDKVISAWKVGKDIYEPTRTTHNKTYNDLLKCGKIGQGYKVLFLDDLEHPQMMTEKVTYLLVDKYRYDIKFDKLIEKLMKSGMSTIFVDNHKTNKLIELKLHDSIKKSFYMREMINFQQTKVPSVFPEVKSFIETKNKTKRQRKSRNKTVKKRF